MRTLVGWHIEMEFQEEGDRTKAAALVRLADGTEVRSHGYSTGTGRTPRSSGSARRSPGPGPSTTSPCNC